MNAFEALDALDQAAAQADAFLSGFDKKCEALGTSADAAYSCLLKMLENRPSLHKQASRETMHLTLDEVARDTRATGRGLTGAASLGSAGLRTGAGLGGLGAALYTSIQNPDAQGKREYLRNILLGMTAGGVLGGLGGAFDGAKVGYYGDRAKNLTPVPLTGEP